MTNRTLIPAAAILILGGAAIAIAAGADRTGDRAERHQERVAKMFERLDINADGAIDATELEMGRKVRFEAADTDKDGKLTKAEIRAAMTKRDEARADRRVERIMDRADANSDGEITIAEYEAAPQRRTAKMFERLDADGDGVITRAEAEAARGGRHSHKNDN